MERKLRKSYMLMFPFFIIILGIIIAIGTWISRSFMLPSMASYQHSANSILEKGLSQSLVNDIIDDGGGIMFIHQDYKVEQLAGIQLIEQDSMSVQEFTEFMSNINNPFAKYKYSTAYDEKRQGWLVVGFPVPIRIQIICTSNDASKEYMNTFIFYITLGLCLGVTLFFFIWCYARKSAKAYSKPLTKVCESVSQIASGQFDVYKLNTSIEEYAQLQENVIKLADQLKEEKRISKQLMDSKRQMLLDISHDLRNPLTTILGYSESLCREEGLSQKERENYLEVIYRNSTRAHALMNDLFEYTRLDDPTFAVNLLRVDLCEFLREFVASYVPDIESAGFESEFDIPEDEYYVMLDGKQMERALGNIISNSLRYNQPGTRIKISLKKQQDQMIIHICDNGIGIEAALCDTIFLPFTRADKARNSKFGGSGLGLSISKKIIEAMEGRIELMSDKNMGCDFLIILPVIM